MSKILNSRRLRIYPEADVKRAEISLLEENTPIREIMNSAGTQVGHRTGAGHGAWGMGHGAWRMGHGALKKTINPQSKIQNPCIP